MSIRFCFLDSFWTKSKRLPKDKIGFVGPFHFLAKHLICRLSLYIYLWEGTVTKGLVDHRPCTLHPGPVELWLSRAFRPPLAMTAFLPLHLCLGLPTVFYYLGTFWS